MFFFSPRFVAHSPRLQRQLAVGANPVSDDRRLSLGRKTFLSRTLLSAALALAGVRNPTTTLPQP